MSKKCTLLWRESHFEVKMYKTHQGRSTFFWSWDVQKVHVFVARSTFSSQHVKNTTCSDRFWTFRCRFAWQAQGIVDLVKSEQNVMVLSQCQLQPSLHHATLHYTTRSATLHYTTPLCYTTLHYAPLHYAQLHYTTLHYTNCITLHHTTPHCTALHCTALHYTTLHHTTPHHSTPHYNYTTLHYPTPPYITLHHITLH